MVVFDRFVVFLQRAKISAVCVIVRSYAFFFVVLPFSHIIIAAVIIVKTVSASITVFKIAFIFSAVEVRTNAFAVYISVFYFISIYAWKPL